MEQTVNERFLRISSKLPIGVGVALGEDIVLKVSNIEYVLNCTKHETYDKQDGTVDVVYVLKSTLE